MKSKVLIRVQRFYPKEDAGPSYDTYEIDGEVAHKQTVLSALQYIYDSMDHTLAFRGACGRGVCGTCTVNMNGRPGLSCMRMVDRDFVVEPLPTFEILRDLVVDPTKRIKKA